MKTRNRMLVMMLMLLPSISSVTFASAIMYANDNLGNLYTLDVDTGAASLIGNTVTIFTDIAFSPSGSLYGISYDRLFTIEPTTASRSYIGTVTNAGTTDLNSLVFASDGTLWAASQDRLITIDYATGAGTVIGTGNYIPAGDLAFSASGDLYLTTKNGTLNMIDQITGGISVVGSIPQVGIYGFDKNSNGTMVGLSYANEIFYIDLITGVGTYQRDIIASFNLGNTFGASFQPVPVPVPSALLMSGVGIAMVFRRKKSLTKRV